MNAEEIYEGLLPDVFPYFPGGVEIDSKRSSIALQGNRPVAILHVTNSVSGRVGYVIAPYTVQDNIVVLRGTPKSPTPEQVQCLKKRGILPIR